jgi:hypothetical protein
MSSRNARRMIKYTKAKSKQVSRPWSIWPFKDTGKGNHVPIDHYHGLIQNLDIRAKSILINVDRII